ncbi:MAG: hypothetical protein ABI607_14875 [Betaproteobacteria bacterium]
MKPEQLRHLSAFLDQALHLAVAEREASLAGQQGDDASLAPTLRDLLARQASKETAGNGARPYRQRSPWRLATARRPW